jgi:hypothetical protein
MACWFLLSPLLCSHSLLGVGCVRGLSLCACLRHGGGAAGDKQRLGVPRCVGLRLALRRHLLGAVHEASHPAGGAHIQ